MISLVIVGVVSLAIGFVVGYNFSNDENKNQIETLERDLQQFRVALRGKKIRK